MLVLLRRHLGLESQAKQQCGGARHPLQSVDLAVRIGRRLAERGRLSRSAGEDEISEAKRVALAERGGERPAPGKRGSGGQREEIEAFELVGRREPKRREDRAGDVGDGRRLSDPLAP